MESCHVRIAGGEDAEKLLAIYAPYVENTAITFEYEVPSIEAIKKASVVRRTAVSQKANDSALRFLADSSPKPAISSNVNVVPFTTQA